MRTPRTLRSALIAVTATAAVGLSATGALAATHHGAPTASTTEAAAFTTAGKRVYVKSVKLRDGSTARLYKLGKHKARADFYVKGSKVGALTARGKNAYANHNGLHVKLTPNGTITSWMDRAKPKPKPQPSPAKRVLVAAQTLTDGSTAKVYKLSTNHYQADILANGSKLSTLDANGRDATGQNNGLYVVLSPDGQLSSWIDNGGSQPGPVTPATDPTPAPEPEPDVQPDHSVTPSDAGIDLHSAPVPAP